MLFFSHCEACLLGRSNLIIFTFYILFFNIIIATPVVGGIKNPFFLSLSPSFVLFYFTK